MVSQWIFGVLFFAVDNSLVPPFGKIFHRRRPANVVIHTEDRCVEAVMWAIDIHSTIEHMRFPIRNIFPRWQIWVHCLSVHSFHLLPFCCYVLSVAQLLLFSGDFGITRLHSGTTCILEHFFRAYMFPFVHSTKKRCRSTLHRSHMLKTVFVCALAGCISKATPHNSRLTA